MSGAQSILPARLLCSLALLAAAADPAGAGSGGPVVATSVVPVVWRSEARGADSLDQLSLEAIVRAMGFHTLRAPSLDAPETGAPFAVIPHAAARRLGAAESHAAVRAVERGLTLVTDGPSQLAALLGIATGPAVLVREVQDVARPDLAIRWPRPHSVRTLARLPRRGASPLYKEKSGGSVLAAVVRRGRGRCLYVAPLVDPYTADGYALFPTLPDVISGLPGAASPLARHAADAYFDPGYRWGVSPDTLARMWRRCGISGVHVAAWYASNDPPYDYDALINALHRQGLLAYAWLEWPYVGKGFWDRHPLWRQKNALLQDAHLDFLYLMDLQNPACMAAALGGLEELLRAEWDGVDVAEFTLTGAGREALEGPVFPEFFTGFTDVGRREFSRVSGFDPLDLFKSGSPHFWKSDTAALHAFYRYRTHVNTGTERQLFSALRSGNRWKTGAGELMLTIVDNRLHPEFDNLLGFSMKETTGILEEFDVTLVVEDPYMEWSTPPARYFPLGAYYRKLLGGRPFMIDINVVPLPEDRKGMFPTAQSTGTEFLELWRSASGETGRACYYCESTVPGRDWLLLPAAMAGEAVATGGDDTATVDAPYTVILRRDGEVTMDGRPWPARGSEGIVVPAGRHVVARAKGSPEKNRLLSISGELLDARRNGRAIEIRYRSTGRCALKFDFAPGAVRIDGEKSEAARCSEGRNSVILAPGGEHTCTVIPPG